MPSYLDDYDFATAVSRNWGIAIKCRACGVEKRWTDTELERRFAGKMATRAAELVTRLQCSCGGRDPVAYFYNSGSRSNGPATLGGITECETRLRRGAA